MKKIIFSVLLVLFSMQLHAQCQANAGGSMHRCDVESPLVLGTNEAASGGIAPYTYSWTIDPIAFAPPIPFLYASDILSDTNSANPSLTYLNIGDSVAFYLEITDAVGCVSKDTLIVTTSYFYQQLSVFDYWINPGDSVFLNLAPNIAGGYGSTNNGLSSNFYQWNPTTGLSNSNLPSGFWASPDTTTFYAATVTDIKGCSKTGGVYYHVFVNTSGIDAIDAYNTVDFFPNPTNGKLEIQKLSANSIDYFELYNSVGQLVNVFDGATEFVDFSMYESGVYQLKYYSQDNVFAQKIIKY
jgi:hypothetical protein